MDCETSKISNAKFAAGERKFHADPESPLRFLSFVLSPSLFLCYSVAFHPRSPRPSHRTPSRRLRSTLIRLVVILLRFPFVFVFFPPLRFLSLAVPLHFSRTLLLRFVIRYVLLPGDCLPLSYVSISALFACALFRDFEPNATFRDLLCEH